MERLGEGCDGDGRGFAGAANRRAGDARQAAAPDLIGSTSAAPAFAAVDGTGGWTPLWPIDDIETVLANLWDFAVADSLDPARLVDAGALVSDPRPLPERPSGAPDGSPLRPSPEALRSAAAARLQDGADLVANPLRAANGPATTAAIAWLQPARAPDWSDLPMAAANEQPDTAAAAARPADRVPPPDAAAAGGLHAEIAAILASHPDPEALRGAERLMEACGDPQTLARAIGLKLRWGASPHLWLQRRPGVPGVVFRSEDARDALTWEACLGIAAARADWPVAEMIDPDWVADWRQLTPGEDAFATFGDYAAMRSRWACGRSMSRRPGHETPAQPSRAG